MHMADINDISTTIASALTEVGVAGKVDVKLDGGHAIVIAGEPDATDVVVNVEVNAVE
jgi:hypothetical protein